MVNPSFMGATTYQVQSSMGFLSANTTHGLIGNDSSLRVGVATTIFDSSGKPDSSGPEAPGPFRTLIFSANDLDTVLGLNGDTVLFGKSKDVTVLQLDVYKYPSGCMVFKTQEKKPGKALVVIQTSSGPVLQLQRADHTNKAQYFNFTHLKT